MPPYQQYRPMQPPRKTGIGAGGITAIVAAVIVIPALLFIAVTAGLMTVAKNHISQGANEPTNSYGNASPSDPNQADPEPTATSTAWTSGPDTRDGDLRDRQTRPFTRTRYSTTTPCS